MTTIGLALANQFGRTWAMLRDAVANVTDDHWRTGDRTELVPARWAYHLVETADYYTQETADAFPWAERFGVDWEVPDADKLPSQEQILAYLDEVQPRMDTWLRAASDEELMGENPFHPGCGKTVMERMLYLLRHNQHHLGQLVLTLRCRDLEGGDWQ